MTAKVHDMPACPHCDEALPDLREGGWKRCAGCGAMVFPPQNGPRVIVAHDSEAASEEISRALATLGLWIIRVDSGSKLLAFLKRSPVDAALVDVGIGDPSAYEIIALLRGEASTSGLKIILLASVFNRAAYKRAPVSLYGADDYVEQHHIPDLLPQKLAALLRVENVGGG